MTENAISAQRSNDETCSSRFSFDGRNYRHGQSRPKSAAAFRPAYCDLDKKVLRFFAYFVEDVGGRDRDGGHARAVRRVRHVHVMYFLEDDTISVIEPRIKVRIAAYISRFSRYIVLTTETKHIANEATMAGQSYICVSYCRTLASSKGPYFAAIAFPSGSPCTARGRSGTGRT